MRKADVYFGNRLAGHLYDLDDHFEFVYEEGYLQDGFPISVTLPLQKEAFVSKTLPSFFDGLIVEGWLLDAATHNWKINPNDRMGLLLRVGKDSVGAVSVMEAEE
jgi:serine/threonine-protein kinase HipA